MTPIKSNPLSAAPGDVCKHPLAALAALAALVLLACAPSKQLCPKDFPLDFSEALAFAGKAALAYEPDSAVRASCGSDSCFILGGPVTKARAFVQRDDAAKVQWVAIRGTASLDDIRLDADYAHARDTVLGMSLHHGFARTTDDLLPIILPLLNPGYRTLITGHSLGGAVAAITALHLQARGFTVKAITFGQPKVTNEAGAKRVKLDLVRFIQGQDIVALVPPVDWVPGSKAGTYAHFGREVAISGGSYECLDRHFARRYDPSSWWAQSQRQAVADHAMDRYIARLGELAGRSAGGDGKAGGDDPSR